MELSNNHSKIISIFLQSGFLSKLPGMIYLRPFIDGGRGGGGKGEKGGVEKEKMIEGKF